MLRLTSLFTVGGALQLAALMAPVVGADPVPADRFDKLHALIKPHAGEEKWASIGWTTNLWDARKRAAAEGKPILLWEMDGHPLGCT
jgi:hypothetical protein